MTNVGLSISQPLILANKFLEEDIEKFLKRMVKFEDVDIYFHENPLKSFLLANVQIDSKSLKYK